MTSSPDSNNSPKEGLEFSGLNHPPPIPKSSPIADDEEDNPEPEPGRFWIWSQKQQQDYARKITLAVFAGTAIGYFKGLMEGSQTALVSIQQSKEHSPKALITRDAANKMYQISMGKQGSRQGFVYASKLALITAIYVGTEKTITHYRQKASFLNATAAGGIVGICFGPLAGGTVFGSIFYGGGMGAILGLGVGLTQSAFAYIAPPREPERKDYTTITLNSLKMETESYSKLLPSIITSEVSSTASRNNT